MTEADVREGMPPVKLSREVDGYVGYMEPYATSHRALDDDKAFQTEVQNVARALGSAVRLARSGQLREPGAGLSDPNPK
jgi:hypothetical protein